MTNFRIFTSILISLLVLGGASKAQAQDELTLDRAIKSALQNNYGIRVAEYDIQTSDADVFRGNAGLLPSVSVAGGATYNNNNSQVDVVQGTDPNTGIAIIETINANGVETSNANLGLNLNWTVFNGFANTKRYELLGATADLTREQNITLIENNVIQVVNAYYQLAKLTQSYGIQAQTLEQSRTRMEFAKNQAEFGSASSLAVLNARVDVNTDSINLVTTELTLENARRNLNYLIGFDLDDDSPLDLEVALADIPALDELENLVRSNNSSIRTAEQSRKLTELNLRLAEASRYPTLGVNGSYGLNYANNGPFSFAPKIFSYGASAGVSLNVPIYNGNQISQSIQKAEIGVAKSTAQITQTQQLVLRDLRNAYFTYQNNRKILELQNLSVEAASENFERTKERFELGQSTNVAFRDAQINLLLAENRLNDLLYDVKTSEMNLLQITGMLLPQ